MARWSAQVRFGVYTLAALIVRADQRCTWCGCVVEKRGYAIDHVHPRALGGSDAHTNLVLACKLCNEKRADDPGISFALAERMAEARRAPAEAWEEVARQTSIPVGRGTKANRDARWLAVAWFGQSMQRDKEHSRAYKAKCKQGKKTLDDVPF